MLSGSIYGLTGGSSSKYNSYTDIAKCMHRRAFLARLAALVRACSLSFALVFIKKTQIARIALFTASL